MAAAIFVTVTECGSRPHGSVTGTRPPTAESRGQLIDMALPLLIAAAAGAVELTPDNWDKKIGGRAAFVKFLAPW